MNNEAAAIVVKDTDVSLLLIYDLCQLECVSHHRMQRLIPVRSLIST